MKEKLDRIFNLLLTIIGLVILVTSIMLFVLTQEFGNLSETELLVFILIGFVILFSGGIFSELTKIKKHLGIK